MGAVDFVEGPLDRGGRVDVLELDLLDDDSHVELFQQHFEADERFGFDFGAADGEDLVHGAVADDFGHHALGEIA